MATSYQVCVALAALRRKPDANAPLDTQLLFGEMFEVDTVEGAWCHGGALRDGYTGWVSASDLTRDVTPTTHRVRALRTYVYSRPDLKSEPLHLVSMNARIAAGRREGRFVETQDGGWIFADHLADADTFESDYVAVAEHFIGTPYFWGGRDSRGLDCSGLVQTAFEAAGVAVPRDSGDQEADFRERWQVLAPGMGLERGDLIFWRGHVGIMTDADMLLHANAGSMAVSLETRADAEARIAPEEGPMRVAIRPKLT
tara:strand:- start:2664 stop:3431 length:768 start_codon:yes stop_codon:yes gene_type:complete